MFPAPQDQSHLNRINEVLL